MSEETIGVGLTPRMKDAFDAIVGHVSRHGAFPSRRLLADALGVNATRANTLIVSLCERRQMVLDAADGTLSGFGDGGVAIFLPNHIAAQLCAFAALTGEHPAAIAADAIVLHLDAQEPAG